MLGYEGEHEKTAEVMRAGYYHTGDTATRDADGYYFYVGRNDDVFKSSDYRISPFELESVLVEHDAVLEAAIVPSPDALRLSVPKAFITLRAGVEPSNEVAQSIFAFARARLAAVQADPPHRIPRAAEDDLRQDPPRRTAQAGERARRRDAAVGRVSRGRARPLEPLSSPTFTFHFTHHDQIQETSAMQGRAFARAWQRRVRHPRDRSGRAHHRIHRRTHRLAGGAAAHRAPATARSTTLSISAWTMAT